MNHLFVDFPAFSVWLRTVATVLWFTAVHGCLEALPSAPPIYNMDLLRALSYLIWQTQCASVLLSASKEPMLGLSPVWRDTLGSAGRARERDRGRDKGQPTVCKPVIRSPLSPHLALIHF